MHLMIYYKLKVQVFSCNTTSMHSSKEFTSNPYKTPKFALHGDKNKKK